jgi:hypothetical protein
MKKVIIFLIVLINITSIYFWNFPYISKTDLITYRLTDKALKRQNAIINSSINGNIQGIERATEQDSIFEKYSTNARILHKINRNNYSALQKIRDLMLAELEQESAFKFQTDTAWIYPLMNRLKPFHYQSFRLKFRLFYYWN